ncbi:uncharacterized protein B0T23DRAFT_308926 [Neurospora hispaniola]|uniref:Uncharacterized protein n=1 Tax=Neurospora hispaniola TaxID=588809 RepID=A0AAJ0IHE8_9PEZI|nr:hypothetical protein B0T23DRAFT_308926 [Neurospora hispaniola]
MSTIQHQRFPAGMAPLEQLPQEVLEIIAQFCGDVAGVSPSEQEDSFTEVITNSYLDSVTSYIWQPSYSDLRTLSLVSKTFLDPARRALYKVVVVKSTSELVRLLRDLLLHPENRRYVRFLVVKIEDHARPLPMRFTKPQPLVLGDRNNFTFSLPVIYSTEINLHTLEDQLMTATIQLCPGLTTARISFGTPQRHIEQPEPASQPVRDPPIYVSLLEDRHSSLKSLTLDFGALLSLTNFKRYVPGYRVGCPPSIERLTLVGNETESTLPYHLFDLNIFSKWLGTNNKLRELRMLHGFDKLVTYKRFNSTQPQRVTWNSILRAYRSTLEVLVLDWYHHFTAVPQARFGRSETLDCLVDMTKLHDLQVPLNALSGREFGLPPHAEDWEVTRFMRTGLPPQWRKINVMVMNPLRRGSTGGITSVTWRVIELRL